jgi:hypothetical protein
VRSEYPSIRDKVYRVVIALGTSLPHFLPIPFGCLFPLLRVVYGFCLRDSGGGLQVRYLLFTDAYCLYTFPVVCAFSHVSLAPPEGGNVTCATWRVGLVASGSAQPFVVAQVAVALRLTTPTTPYGNHAGSAP